MLVVLYLLVAYYFFGPCDSSYAGESYTRMCMKIVWLDSELVKDAIRKIETVQHFKDYYRHLISYQLGRTIYDIRHKFKRMTYLYTMSFDQMNNKDYDHNVYIQRLVEVQHLSMEIDHLIQSINENAQRRQKKKERRERAFRQAHPTASTVTRPRATPPSTKDKFKYPRRMAEGRYFEGNLRTYGLGNRTTRFQGVGRWRHKPVSVDYKHRIGG